MNYPVDGDYEDDSDASAVEYVINVRTMNRCLSHNERDAVERIVQDAINLMATKLTFAVRSRELAYIFATRVSSSIGSSTMLPEQEISHDGSTME